MALINGGRRERIRLQSSIGSTFGQTPFQADASNVIMPLHGNRLIERAEEITLYIFSLLEFQNNEGKALLFQNNLDERIMACLQEICREGNSSKKDTSKRLFVWEAAPEIKKEKSMQ